MESLYQESQRIKVVKLLKEESPIFYGAKGGKYFMTKNRDFVITDYKKNFFKPIEGNAIKYFSENGIAWWGGKKPTGHLLSSQIACVNHLYPLRDDKKAVLALLQSVSTNFVDVLKIETDKYDSAYIQFESVSDKDHLNEKQSTRGSNCTSVDALVFAVHKDGSKWLIPIEWKFTEHYSNQNKATEGAKKDPVNCKGEVRKKRYTDLINQSKQLKGENHKCYYFEPFYQLMRQTLWTEQILSHKEFETIKADNFMHLHIIPEDNADLLKKEYKCSGENMETTWKNHLVDKDKYVIISPEKLLSNIDSKKYGDLVKYLTTRYWNK
jgi:hypothetical protein